MSTQLPARPDDASSRRRGPSGWTIFAIVAALGIGGVFGIAAAMPAAERSVAESQAAVTPSPTPTYVEPGSTDYFPNDSVEPTVEPTVEPENESGKFGIASCDWSGMYNRSGFIGSVKLVNDGNVDIQVSVDFAWLMGDGSKLNATQRLVDVKVGANKLVFFKAPATLNSVGLFQDHPGYYKSNNCKIKAAIV